ncbi:hypothetical protein CPLU01_14124 [Colletotrichum plurivorum]|uniref:Uncharacterized protein n=1 Tax=Colletotrichum plurivorum TaxID=2175906 RepID=A0A8H6JMR0_9PEZI|nr:hypothetical protein CPLU01_14124 [Colletotrichum plurivorum]
MLALIASLALAAAQTAEDISRVPNPVVSLSSCDALSCSPSDRSICSTSDGPGPRSGVGIAAQVFNVSFASFYLTLTDGLVENGFTGIGTKQYEYSDQQLFVGVDPDLNEADYPSGCALMMQYLGQTFPKQNVPGNRDTRPETIENTTSCDGALDRGCRYAIFEMIRAFNSSGSSWDHDRCARLSKHVNEQLRSKPTNCGKGGGTLIANYINVTAGALPQPDSTAADDKGLTAGGCRQVLPERYELHKVAEVRQFYFQDPPSGGAEFYGRVFGGRGGFTPVAAVVYSANNRSEPDVKFTCMQTFEPDGSERRKSAGHRAVSTSVFAVLLGMALGF